MPLEFQYQLTPLSGVLRNSLRISENDGYRSECQFVVDSPDNSFSPAVGEPIDILEHITGSGDPPTRIFAGPIKAVNRTVIEGTGIRRNVVICADYTDLAYRVLAGERTYVNQKLNDIIRDLITNALGYGVLGTFVPPGEGPTIKELKLDYATVAEAFDELMRLAGGGIWWIDEEKEFRFQLGAKPSADFSITNSTNWIEAYSLAVEESLEGYANKLVVTASKYETDPQVETFASGHPSQAPNGSRKNWTTVYELSRVPTVKVNGVTQTVGIDGVDTGKQWYWSQGSKSIDQDDAATPLTSLQTLTIEYIGLTRETVVVENSAQVSARGIFERRVELTRTTSSGDLQDTADNLLAILSQPTYTLRLKVVKGNRTVKPKIGDRVDINRAGYPVLTGLTVSAVRLGATGEAPEELQREVEARKGPRLPDGLSLVEGGSASAGVASASSGGGGGGTGGPFAIENRTGVSGTVSITSTAERLFLRLDITGDVTIGFPSSMPIGAEIAVMVVQDGTGDRRVNWAPEWRGSGSLLNEVAQPITALIVRGVVASGTKIFVTSVTQGVEP